MTYTRRLRTDKVAGLTQRCPECKRPMEPTGTLLFDGPPLSRWVVEYHCARCDEYFVLHAPEHAARVAAIADEALAGPQHDGQ